VKPLWKYLQTLSEEKGEWGNDKINSLGISKEYKCISRGLAPLSMRIIFTFYLFSPALQRNVGNANDLSAAQSCVSNYNVSL